MNTEMLDFWGNFLLNASKGQKQLEEMAEWTRRALMSFAEMSASLQKLCEVEQVEPETPEFLEMWSKMGDVCQKSFIEGCSRMWGIAVVSDEHLDLIKKYEELKEKTASQEETIRHLRLLLNEAKREAIANAALRPREPKAETGDRSNGQ